MITYEPKKPRIKRKAQEVDAKSPLNRSLKALSGISEKGCENRDPVSHVMDCFTASFHAHGLAMSKLAGGEEDKALIGSGEQPKNADEQTQTKPGADFQTGLKKEEQATGGMEEHYQQTKLQKQSGRFIHKFADIAFQRGNIAAGILQGEGKMLLVSSMKQAAGQKPPTNQRQTKLWGDASVQREVPSDDSKIIFNEGDVKTAVGIVIDSVNSGRNALENLSRIVTEGSMGIGEDAVALERMYPFLSMRRERELIKSYQEQLSNMESTDNNTAEKASLQYGLRKTQAIIQKKQAMCARFAAVSDEMAQRAKIAEEEFAQAAFPAAIYQVLSDFIESMGGDGGSGEPGGAADPNDPNAVPAGSNVNQQGETPIPEVGAGQQGEQAPSTPANGAVS